MSKTIDPTSDDELTFEEAMAELDELVNFDREVLEKVFVPLRHGIFKQRGGAPAAPNSYCRSGGRGRWGWRSGARSTRGLGAVDAGDTAVNV